MDNYKSNEDILQRLFKKETSEGLNGAIILIHAGTDARRTDKLYEKLPVIIETLQKKGYSFKRIDELR
jgi:endoglucanase